MIALFSDIHANLPAHEESFMPPTGHGYPFLG